MASKRHRRRKSCTGKQRYDRKGAEAQAHWLRRTTREWITAYKCEFCTYWHVGHPPWWVRQAIKAKKEKK